MPASFLSRHRTICDTIQEIRETAEAHGITEITKLCDEASAYAKRMSEKLMEYKNGSINRS